MNITGPQELDQRAALRARHPWLDCGLEFGPGWHTLIGELATEIEAVVRKYDIDTADLHAQQAKEKWGTLTVYVYTGHRAADEEITKLCAHYAKRSVHVCENCGRPGQLMNAGSLMTVCPDHTPAGARPVGKA